MEFMRQELSGMPRRLRIMMLAASITMAFSPRAGSIQGSAEGPGGPDFPNDDGPAQVDVTAYPQEIQADYRIFARRCSQCHTLARAINSQNLQLSPDEQKAAKLAEPDIFKDEKIWRISEVTWTGYVGKMFGKPGSIIRTRPAELDQIIEFLVYDSKARKTGAQRAAWRAQRQKLLDDFRETHPARYRQLFGNE
jgi:hypothetical protein